MESRTKEQVKPGGPTGHSISSDLSRANDDEDLFSCFMVEALQLLRAFIYLEYVGHAWRGGSARCTRFKDVGKQYKHHLQTHLLSQSSIMSSMTQDKSKVSTKRSATEYRLSITSNPGSRRSSLGGVYEGSSASNSTRPGLVNQAGDEDENFVKEFILPQIRELSDSMITLDANFTQLNFIHESLVDLNESLGALLYGLMCNSWCVDFPHVSHDISEELNLAKRLESLSHEKEMLSQQLVKLKNQHATKTEPSAPQFVAPGLPTTQLRKFIQRDERSQRHPREIYNYDKGIERELHENDYGDDYDEDDNNSEASFISNPAADAPEKRQKSSQTSGSSESKRSSNKLRRKSILHAIRNSVASTADLNLDGGNSNDLRRTSRLSLGGGATRIVPPLSSAERHNSGIIGGRPIRSTPINNPSGVSSNFRRSKSLAKRPPFR